jgi:hypothetical protein
MNVIQISDTRRTPLDEAVEMLREALDAGQTPVYPVMKNMAHWLSRHDHPEELALQAMKELGVVISLPEGDA